MAERAAEEMAGEERAAIPAEKAVQREETGVSYLLREEEAH